MYAETSNYHIEHELLHHVDNVFLWFHLQTIHLINPTVFQNIKSDCNSNQDFSLRDMAKTFATYELAKMRFATSVLPSRKLTFDVHE